MKETIANKARSPAVARMLHTDTFKCMGRTYAVVGALTAPFIGLVFVLAFPLIGLACATWLGMKAITERCYWHVFGSRPVQHAR